LLTWLFLALALGGGLSCHLWTQGQRRALAVGPALLWLLGLLVPLLLGSLGKGTVLIASTFVQGAGALLGLWALRAGHMARSEGAEKIDVSWRERLTRAGLCVTAGLCLGLGHPITTDIRSSAWALAWVGMLPLLWAMRGLSPGRAFGYGLLAGWVLSVTMQWWLANVYMMFMEAPGPLAALMLVVHMSYRGLQLALFGAIYAWFRQRRGIPLGPFAVAALYVVIEHFYPFLFPMSVGAAQYANLPVIQVADLFGTAGVGFVVVAFGASLYGLVAARHDGRALPWRSTAAVAAMVVATLSYGAVRLATVGADAEAAPTLKAGIVQPNIDVFSEEARHLSGSEAVAVLRSNILKLHLASARLEAQGADVLFWPETIFSPVGAMLAKHTPHFAAGLTASGDLVLWSKGADGRLTWSPPVIGGLQDVRALHAGREDALCAVGGHGLLACWDGANLHRPQGVTDHPLNGVNVVHGKGGSDRRRGSPVELWAVGDHGAVLRGTFSKVDTVNSGTTKHLRAVTALGPGQAIAVGDGGTVVTIADDEVFNTTVGPENLLAAFKSPEGTGIWLAGERGAIYALGTSSWDREATSIKATLRAFAGRSANALWAVGDAGTVLRRQMTEFPAWESVAAPANVDFTDASVDADGTLMVLARDGRVWARHDTTWAPLKVAPLRALTWLPYNRFDRVPRDALYLAQSDVPLPSKPHAAADTARFNWQRSVIQRGFRSPLVFGAITEPAQGDGWNTAIALDEHGRLRGVTDKFQLVPVAETLPDGLVYGLDASGFRDVSKDLYALVPEASRFDRPDGPGVLELAGVRMGVLVCYEDILTEVALELADQAPDLLVNITNDAWFGRTTEPYQHASLSVLRAVELRRTLLRSTMTGVSALILPTGAITEVGDLDEARELLVEAPLLQGTTVYATIGNLFVHLCLVALVVLAVLSGRRREDAAG